MSDYVKPCGCDEDEWCGFCRPYKGCANCAKKDAEIERLRQEGDDSHALNGKLSALLTGVVNSVRGEPPPLKSWSGHDAPELVRGVVQEIEQLRAALEELVDLQNGPPLHKYTTDWYKAMVEASKLLSRPESVAFYRQKLGKEVAKAGGDDE